MIGATDQHAADEEDSWESMSDENDEEDSDSYDEEDEGVEDHFSDYDENSVFLFSESIDPSPYLSKFSNKKATVIEHPEEFLRLCLFVNAANSKGDDEERCFKLLNKGKTQEQCMNALNEKEKEKLKQAEEGNIVLFVITSKEDYLKKSAICQLSTFLIEYANVLSGGLLSEKFLEVYFESEMNAEDLMYDNESKFVIGLPFHSNHPVLLLAGNEDEYSEMRNFFEGKEVPVLTVDSFDQKKIRLGDCTIVISEEFLKKLPQDLTQEEIETLQFYIHTNGVLFHRAKELFNECKDIDTLDYDNCEELLKDTGLCKHIYDNSVVNKRRKRRHILDDAKVKEYVEVMSFLPKHHELAELTYLLPNEVVTYILHFLPVINILDFRLVSHTANIMCLQDGLWREVNISMCKKFNFLSPIRHNKVSFDLPHYIIYRNHIYPLLLDYKIMKSILGVTPSNADVVHESKFDEMIAPAVYFDTSMKTDEYFAIGSTKLSGYGDLPKDLPKNAINSNMTFVLQINLDECSKTDLFGIPYHFLKNQIIPVSIYSTCIIYIYRQVEYSISFSILRIQIVEKYITIRDLLKNFHEQPFPIIPSVILSNFMKRSQSQLIV